MRQKFILQTLATVINVFIFSILAIVITTLWWKIVGEQYLFSSQPMGGDYFNALTYAKFFKDHLPLPPQGWLPFWNEGVPVIGGYPWFFFYLIQPLTKFFEIAQAQEILAVTSLLIFFILSFWLFWYTSKNPLIAFVLTLILFVTRATYYSLTTGAFINGASAQWYLPAVLLLIYKWHETTKRSYLISAAVLVGFSLLHHAPTSVLMIVLPSVAVLFFLTISSKVVTIRLFLIIAAGIGSMGLYGLFLQTFFGLGTTTCQDPECWGAYPRHFIAWLNWYPLFIIIAFLVLSLITFLFKSKMRFALLFAPLAALIPPLLYDVAAYFHLINGPANVVYPTRTFWVIVFFLLLLSSTLWYIIQKEIPKISYFLSLVVTACILYVVGLQPFTIHTDASNTVPVDAALYTIPKYQTKSLSELVPSWIPLEENNWRLDSFNQGLTHWWNFASQMPSTRGYTNYSLGIHQVWLYLLQVATRAPSEDVATQELVKNRALFLIDAYGIKFRENSTASFPRSILDDPSITINHALTRDLSWFEFSKERSSPIVSPTNTNPVLFVGDDKGYQNFIRTIAMTNLNSRVLIPVKGPTSINKLTKYDFARFRTLILYRYQGNDWKRISDFVKKGGQVFVDTADKAPKEKLPDIFPIESATVTQANGPWNATVEVADVDATQFSPLSFEGNPWKFSTSSVGGLRPWAKTVATNNGTIVIAGGTIGQGKVFWSGINLLFHSATHDNFEEAKLFHYIIKELTTPATLEPSFQVNRPIPEKIEIKGINFSGIYFKENYHRGWNAKVNGKNVPVYPAGLDFMYVPVPARNQQQLIEATITYSGSSIEWGLFIMSIFFFLISLFYLVFPKPLRVSAIKTIELRNKTFKKITNWAISD
ncbi:hypothetical protein HY405_01580 [Candidatus Microgenomates bacterium]|nr:hypothetical protein [Candidatus Microgenomates bacterium]